MQVVYLFFFNALWVWVPLILLYDSGAAIIAAFEAARPHASSRSTTALGDGAYTFCAATLVLYSVLVPAVIATSKA